MGFRATLNFRKWKWSAFATKVVIISSYKQEKERGHHQMNSMLVPAPAIITLKENKTFDWLKLTELMKMTESEHASGFHSHENFYVNIFM